MSGELTLAANVLNTIEQYLAEAGTPLTAEQRSTFDAARTYLAEQVASVAAFDRRRSA